MQTLSGRTIIVTGGGSGIGAACARRLALDGATVVIAGRTEGRLTAAVGAIEGGVVGAAGRVHPVVADVTEEDSVRALVAAALELGPPLAGVVANAGGGGAI